MLRVRSAVTSLDADRATVTLTVHSFLFCNCMYVCPVPCCALEPSGDARLENLPYLSGSFHQDHFGDKLSFRPQTLIKAPNHARSAARSAGRCAKRTGQIFARSARKIFSLHQEPAQLFTPGGEGAWASGDVPCRRFLQFTFQSLVFDFVLGFTTAQRGGGRGGGQKRAAPDGRELVTSFGRFSAVSCVRVSRDQDTLAAPRGPREPICCPSASATPATFSAIPSFIPW